MLVANKTQFFSLDRIHGRDHAFSLSQIKKKGFFFKDCLSSICCSRDLFFLHSFVFDVLSIKKAILLTVL